MNFDIPKPKKTAPVNNDRDRITKASPLTSDTRMSVSGILHRGDAKSVCILLENDTGYAEIRMPEGEVLSCKGFDDEEIEEIIAYLTENMDDILNAARDVNPMKAFMK